VSQSPNQPSKSEDMLELAQTRALDKIQKKGVAAAIDAETWMRIGLAMVELYLECKKRKNSEAEMVRSTRNPTLFQRIRLRRALVKHVGRKKLNEMKNEGTLIDALVEVGAEASEPEVKTFVAQVLQG
jgi:hypothetical protein